MRLLHSRFLLVFACLLAALAVFPRAAHAASKSMLVRVTADRVNMRAKPSLDSEVVGQVSAGDVLVARSFMQEWVEVMPPEGIELWVHNEFIEDDQVTASKLNIRAGAGINYSVVGLLERGDRVKVMGRFGEWLKIEPPLGAGLWISNKLVEMVNAREQKPRPSETPADLVRPPTAEEQEARAAEAPAGEAAPAVARDGYRPPSDLDLIPLEGQGKEVQVDGILKRIGFLFNRPSRFRLVSPEGPRSDTLCYVRGNIAQLNTFLGQRMKVQGRLYWVQDEKYPVLIPERIAPMSMP